MALEITGKLIQLLPEVGGTSKSGNAWKKREFVIETNDQYPKQICASLWGDNVDLLANFQIGEEIKMSFNIESRSWNDKWFTDVRAWKLEKVTAATATAPTQGSTISPEVPPFTPEPMASVSEDEHNDLPF